MSALMDVVRSERVTVTDLGSQIKQARIDDGRSAQVLATLADISTGYWYQIENEQRSWISEEVLRRIEKVLGADFGVKCADCDRAPESE